MAFQFGHQLAAEAVQFGDGQHEVAFYFAIDLAQTERRPSETAKLVFQTFGREWAFLGGDESHLRFGFGDVAEFVARDDRKNRAGDAVGFEIDRPLEARLVASIRLANATIEFRIAGLPKFVTDVNALKIDRVFAK